MRPESIKTTGYLVSCVSVALLGWAAYPGAEKAGLTAVLVAGLAASVVGMGLRWRSYELERRSHAGRPLALRPTTPERNMGQTVGSDTSRTRRG
jgi:hypothetical protein